MNKNTKLKCLLKYEAETFQETTKHNILLFQIMAVRISFDISDDTLLYSFVPHLSAAFSRKGVSLLADEHDKSCESIASLLVFSENYMSSKEFLEEVVKTIQRRHDKDHVVAAIYYGVSRSNVQKLKGSFGKGLFDQGIFEHVSQWRNALAEIASLLAYEASNNQSDCEFVENISRDVYEKIFPKERIGVYSRMLPEIENLLCKQQWGVKRIGFWGMPGIGKTMLAKVVFDQMCGDYDVTCLLQNFHETFQKKGLYRLMQEHFKNLKLEQRVLVVLDDVRNYLDAESFLGGLESLSHGSLIIVTSRDVQVLTQCGVNHTYKVEGLNEREAQRLFSCCAFARDVTEKHPFEELSREVIDYANGNPLALRLYGEMMSTLEDPNQKKTFLLGLKQTPPHQIVEVVKSSYYELSDNEKNILMYIALFFTGEKAEYVSTLLQDLGFFPDIGIDRLVENSLVTITNNKLEIHSMVQAVVQTIRSCHQLKINEDAIASFKCVLGTTDLEAISLDASILNPDDNLPLFGSMYNLRFLKIYNSDPENRCAALRYLPSGLRFIHWENYPWQSLPQDFDPSNLVELNMPFSQLQRLWGVTKSLNMLKRINLSYSQNLHEVMELSEALNLEQIDLRGCKNLLSSPAIHKLQKLPVVNLSGCTRINSKKESISNVELKSYGSFTKENFPPNKLNDESLHEDLDGLERSHSLDFLKRLIQNLPKVEIPPTFKNMFCERACEMGQSVRLRLERYLVPDPSS